jgi:hypothetical protein
MLVLVGAREVKPLSLRDLWVSDPEMELRPGILLDGA